MASKWYKELRLLDWGIIAVSAVLTGLVWRGFNYQNPYYLKSTLFVLLPIAFKLLIPLFWAGFVWLYIKVKRGRLKAMNAVLLVGSMLFLTLLIYPVLETLYLTRNLDVSRHMPPGQRLHPYLQLEPTSFKGESPKPLNEIRIMCIGGSTTEFKDTNGRGWPIRVQEKLRSQTKNQGIAVYNMGRQWYTTLHSLINYQVNLRHHKPDAIVVMHTINDLLHNADFNQFSIGPFREDYGHFFGPIAGVVTRKSLWTSFFDALKNAWYFTDPPQPFDQTTFPGLAPFKRNLGTLIDLAKLDGVRIFLMTQPSLLRPNLNEKEKELLYMLNAEAVGLKKRWSFESALTGFKAYTDTIKQVTKQRDVALIDLSSAVKKDLNHFTDDVHYTDRTFDLIAENVSQAIMESGAFSQPQ